MVERFEITYDADIGIIARPNQCGYYVRYSDYEALRADLYEKVKRERDDLDARLHLITIDRDRCARRAEAAERLAGARVKALEWEDADEGMCTKWRAAALGGHYELVALDGDGGGLAVNFHWGRPLSFWFIQGEPDERGPTGPKMFPTLEDAKAAAQSDYERRILSALAEPAREADAVRALAVVKECLTVHHPSEQAVTEEWREIKQHVQPRIADGYTAVAISKPGYWFVKGPGPAAAIRSLKGGRDAQ